MPKAVIMTLDRIIAVRTEKTVYRDSDRVIKVYYGKNRDSAVFAEALNQSLAAEAGVCVPKISGVTDENGKWAIVSEFVEGETLEQLIEANIFEIREYMSSLARIHARVFNKSFNKTADLRAKISEILESADISGEIKEKLFCRLESIDPGDNICHGDFMPDNIVITEDGRACILDWENASAGPAFADAANTYLKLCYKYGEKAARFYLDAVSGLGIDRQKTEDFIPVAAAALAVRGNLSEREFMNNYFLNIFSEVKK